MMKNKNIVYIAIALLLAACSEEVTNSATQQHPNGAIELKAGIVEGGGRVTTRAGAEDHHDNPGHLTLTKDTKLTLRVSGKWKHGDTTTDVIKYTTATVGDESATGSKHNDVSCSPKLYWDDYGMADPDNATVGRTEGLTIYGAAIDNKKDDGPAVSDWTALSWTLTADQTGIGNTPADKDLLISNNVQATYNQNPDETDCGTYKFEKRDDGKLLEFAHALSKITVNLKAGDGFANSVFANTPEVKLTSNEANASTNTEWPIITGKVNITNGNVDLTGEGQGTPSAITMYNTATANSGWTKTYEALVMPGSVFKKDAIIARINADGNIYYVKADKIRAAINSETHDTDDLTKAGKNYILNIVVNKTDIVVTATVADWTDIEAAEELPVINVSAAYGIEGTATSNDFSFYRSTLLDKDYSKNMTLVDNTYYPEESFVSKTDNVWTMSTPLYWPDHNTHYQFRGVWPRTAEVTSGVVYPKVEVATHESEDYQVIKVQNVKYEQGTFPSDLMIGRPEFAYETQQCTNNEPGHTKTTLYSGGICATEGKINLNFRYMMSQVEVHLSTTTGSNSVELGNAVVEIVNVYNSGDVKLGDRGVFTTGDKGFYTLDALTDNLTTTTVDESLYRWSAIVPQPLAYTSAQHEDNLKFRITITNTNGTPDNTTDDTQDVYYADIQPIKVKVKGSSETPAAVSAWESGKHYIYELKLTKTDIEVTATLTDWTTVEASEEVWF